VARCGAGATAFIEGRAVNPAWICCQLGAREHYAIPRALLGAGSLRLLVTDAWVSPVSPAGILPGHRLDRLRERYHPALAEARIRHATLDVVAFEIGARTRGWDRILSRNEWFKRWTARELRWEAARAGDEPRVLFSYSYTALEAFRFAKRQGWTTVLGQIDPGPVEERLVADEHARRPDLPTRWERAPQRYWNDWAEECVLADHILVNSEWSREALREAGVPDARLAVMPLSYDPPAVDAGAEHTYPERFTAERPLRVLFLGQVNLRKGMAHVMDAMRLLDGEPVEWIIVGPSDFPTPDDLRGRADIRWEGPVKRSEAARYYREADVFLFPTLSDGFGLTQLEAMAWGVPVIATRRCGDVVQPGVDGWTLNEVSGAAVASVVRECVARPMDLARYSNAARARVADFSLDHLRERLLSLEPTVVGTS
jgi:glycosyltransferase involved in cell wall biosynthesis